TFLGGATSDLQDGGSDITLDSAGNAYVVGRTEATDFPLLNPLQATAGGSSDGYVTILNAAGSAVLFSTYLGGSLDDVAQGVALGAQNSIYVAGVSQSPGFTTTACAFMTTNQAVDAFVMQSS